MKKRVSSLVAPLALAAVIGAGVGTPQVLAGKTSGVCSSGVLATDPAGDVVYAGADGTPVEDPGTDVISVAVSQAGDAVTFTTTVVDLSDGFPVGGTGHLFSLSIGRPDGSVIDVTAERDLGMEPVGSIDGETEGVTAVFDAAAETISVTGPKALLGENVERIGLPYGESRQILGALAPRTDQVSGTCAYSLATGGTASENASDQGKNSGNSQASPTRGEVGFDPESTTVAVIDTGIRADHVEFDYDIDQPGPNGQLVGWWDFSGANPSVLPPDEWYEGHKPYDVDGHGTGTSAMAAGLNTVPGKTLSACPGCNLAVAKVHNEVDDVLDGSIERAIRWATQVIGADVISISIGQAGPIPAALHGVDEAAKAAREAGVLVVFSNGNGWGNAGVPGQPGGFKGFGNSPHVLSVGADGTDSYTTTTDPEVVAQFSVMTANTDGAYSETAGTSFAAPFVAGAAARLVGEAGACGVETTPDLIERVIKHTATDSDTPPSFEGYGKVDVASTALAADVLCGRADEPVPDSLTASYVEQVSGNERNLWSETLDPAPAPNWSGDGLALDGSATLAAGESAEFSGTPAARTFEYQCYGLDDAQCFIYELKVLSGTTLDIAISTLPAEDYDVYLYDASGTEVVLDNLNGPGTLLESGSATVAPGTYYVMVTPYMVVAPSQFDLSLAVS